MACFAGAVAVVIQGSTHRDSEIHASSAGIHPGEIGRNELQTARSSTAASAGDSKDLGRTQNNLVVSTAPKSVRVRRESSDGLSVSNTYRNAQESTATDRVSPDVTNHSFFGPRPYLDVTAYGAKGDGLTNDTRAIQKAILAACSRMSPAGVNSGGGVYFPPGNYRISQQQTPTPTNVPILAFRRSALGCISLEETPVTESA